MLRCLLHVSATGALHQESVLTPWDAECNLLRWYFGWPSDAYSATVEDVKTCVVGQPLLQRQLIRNGMHSTIRLNLSQALSFAVLDLEHETLSDDCNAGWRWLHGAVDSHLGSPVPDLLSSDSQSLVDDVEQPGACESAEATAAAATDTASECCTTVADVEMCGCKETPESSEPFVHAKAPIEEGVLSEQTVQAVLRSWSIQDAVADIPVLLLPEPIVYLIQHRKWKRLLILVRWQRHMLKYNELTPLMENWPPQQSPVWAAEGLSNQPVAMHRKMDGQTFAEVTALLQRLAPAGLASVQDAREKAKMHADLEDSINTLQSWELSLRELDGTVPGFDQERLGKFEHTAMEMITSIRFCMTLSGGAASLCQALRHAIELVVPKALVPTLIGHLENPRTQPPGASTVRRAELSLDVALMVHRRSRVCTSNEVVRFMWCDSSPLVGYDWLWSQFHEIRRLDLVPVCQAMHRITRAIREAFATVESKGGSADDLFQPLPDWGADLAAVKTSIVEHISPPTSVASGQRGIAHKVRALVHQWHLEIPEHIGVSGFADTFQCVCSDMGVEFGITDFHAEEVSALLPSWINRAELQRDVQQEEEGSPGSLGSPDNKLISDADEMGELSSDGDAGPPVDGIKREFFMEEGIPIYGLQHCVHNLTKSIHESLTYWSKFYNMLKNVGGLLMMKERRERFSATCLQGTHFQHRAHLFKRFSKTLYEKRWREVCSFLKSLQELLPTLRQAWDENLYRRGVDGSAQSADDVGGGPAFDPGLLTQTLGDNLFNRYVPFLH